MTSDSPGTVRVLAVEQPHLPVVVLTTYSDDQRVLAALRAGARGYLTKDAGAEEIHAAVTSAARGKAHLSPEVQGEVAHVAGAERVGLDAPFPVTVCPGELVD